MSFGIATIMLNGAPELAVLRGNRVVPLAKLVPDAPSTTRKLFADWTRWCDMAEAALSGDDDPGALSAEDVIFQSPVPDPPTIYCIGANYADHAREMDDAPKSNGDVPYHFLVPAAALTGHQQEVRRPPGVEMLDWEVELAAVIGQVAEHVDPEEALDYVAGYTVANDVSARDPQLVRDPIFGVRWLAMKAFPTFLPMGPALVPAKFVSDPMNLHLKLKVNGEIRQDSNTNFMITSLQEQISHLSRITPLQPGDVLLTGTPAGTAAAHGSFLSPGDHLSASVEGVGTLENSVVQAPEPKRSPARNRPNDAHAVQELSPHQSGRHTASRSTHR